MTKSAHLDTQGFQVQVGAPWVSCLCHSPSLDKFDDGIQGKKAFAKLSKQTNVLWQAMEWMAALFWW